jgi:DNA-binding Lrp family transcriptional regulator
MKEDKGAWLTAVQRDIPLVRHPFADLGERFGMSESETIDALGELFESGKARRMGGVFDVAGLGYRSALCAAVVAPDALEQVAARLVGHPGMTHCYQRGWPSDLDVSLPEAPPDEIPNLWFTISAMSDRFAATIDELRSQLAPWALFVLPANRRFKIDVVFDTGSGGDARAPDVRRHSRTSVREGEPASVFSEEDRALVRAMQGQIPLVPAPYDEIARELGRAPEEVLETLRGWLAGGVLRRVGVILRHRKLGFRANGMCFWNAPLDEVETAGNTLASFREVTHCYERDLTEGFPYNLFAMIHADSYELALGQFHTLAQASSLPGGSVLFSLREFKKTSPRYFCEGMSDT